MGNLWKSFLLRLNDHQKRTPYRNNLWRINNRRHSLRPVCHVLYVNAAGLDSIVAEYMMSLGSRGSQWSRVY